MGDFFKVYGPIVLLVALGFLAAYQFVDPAPPRSLTIATGSESGAYHAFGLRYREILARDGIEVTLVSTAGSVENLGLLAEEEGDTSSDPGDARVDLAFVQSGIGAPAGFPNLVALASLYYEPLWVFTRGSEAPGRLSALAGRRLAVGAEGSGTRYVALQLLAANQIGREDGTKIEALGSSEAVAALQTGLIDAAFLVTSQRNQILSELLEQQGFGLMSFERAEAYARRFPHLSAVTLPEGVLDLANNIPGQEVTLVSPVATLVAREHLHPALIDLVMRAAQEIHGGQGLFEAAGQFPSAQNVDFPLSAEAERFFKSGPSFLRRVLPFWAATLVERTWILILPVLTLLIPLLRIAPPTYRWQVRRRIYRWYRDLRELEAELQAADARRDAVTMKSIRTRLAALQDEVGQVVVPLSYADNLYHLRLHIEFVRERYDPSIHTL